jgi:hypothetical protein
MFFKLEFITTAKKNKNDATQSAGTMPSKVNHFCQNQNKPGPWQSFFSSQRNAMLRRVWVMEQL